jgi:hypothetical protein
MKENMDDADAKEFEAFIEKYWGSKTNKTSKAKVVK